MKSSFTCCGKTIFTHRYTLFLTEIKSFSVSDILFVSWDKKMGGGECRTIYRPVYSTCTREKIRQLVLDFPCYSAPMWITSCTCSLILCALLSTLLTLLSQFWLTYASGLRKHCPLCNKYLNGDMKTHMDSVHLKMQRVCDICGKSFSNHSNLRMHVKQKHLIVKNLCKR